MRCTGRCSRGGPHSDGQSRLGWPVRSSSLSISSSRGGFMRKRCTVIILTIASMISANGLVAAQTTGRPEAIELVPVGTPSTPLLFAPDGLDTYVAQQPAGSPPTPRHTGIKALTTHLVTNFKYLPSKENLLWAGAGGGLALAVHPFDDNVNEALVDNDTAEKIFKPGEILGELGTLLGSASVVYAVGRIKDQPKVSHLGMDLIEALAMSEALTQTLKYTVRRERPDGSSKNSFPSGHAADTFAVATALERHLSWKYSIPGYMFASYVAASRLPSNRHWLSDVVFGATVGIISGRTVGSHEREDGPSTTSTSLSPVIVR